MSSWYHTCIFAHSHRDRHTDLQKHNSLPSIQVPNLRTANRHRLKYIILIHGVCKPFLIIIICLGIRRILALLQVSHEKCGNMSARKHLRWTNQNHCWMRPLLKGNICNHRDHYQTTTFLDSRNVQPSHHTYKKNYPSSTLLNLQASLWLFHLHQRCWSHVSMLPLEISHRSNPLRRFSPHAAACHAAAAAVLQLLRKGREQLFQTGTGLAWRQISCIYIYMCVYLYLYWDFHIEI